MMKAGAELIADERRRQIEQEGWTKEHDAKHVNGELALAAACYTIFGKSRERFSLDVNTIRIPRIWPWQWDIAWWKPTPNDRIRELVKAGALIAAEIDRLQAEEARNDV